jgi:hypothetical protein
MALWFFESANKRWVCRLGAYEANYGEDQRGFSAYIIGPEGQGWALYGRDLQQVQEWCKRRLRVLASAA